MMIGKRKLLKTIPLLILFVGLIFFNLRNNGTDSSISLTLEELDANAQSNSESCDDECNAGLESSLDRSWARANDFSSGCVEGPLGGALWTNISRLISPSTGSPTTDIARAFGQVYDILANDLPDAYECLANSTEVMNNDVEQCMDAFFDCGLNCP